MGIFGSPGQKSAKDAAKARQSTANLIKELKAGGPLRTDVEEVEEAVFKPVAEHEVNRRAREELLDFVKQAPNYKSALADVRQVECDREILEALDNADNPLKKLKAAGCDTVTAARCVRLLPLALAYKKPTTKAGRCRSWLGHRLQSAIFLLIIAVVLGIIAVFTLLTGKAGWEPGICNFSSFTNSSYTRPCTGECLFDVSIRSSDSKLLKIFNWAPPRRRVYVQGDLIVFNGDPFRCCTTRTLECCAFLEISTFKFCDNWPHRDAKDGERCPTGNWKCLFKYDSVKTKEVSEMLPDYHLPAVFDFSLASGIFGVMAFLLAAARKILWILCKCYMACFGMCDGKIGRWLGVPSLPDPMEIQKISEATHAAMNDQPCLKGLERHEFRAKKVRPSQVVVEEEEEIPEIISAFDGRRGGILGENVSKLTLDVQPVVIAVGGDGSPDKDEHKSTKSAHHTPDSRGRATMFHQWQAGEDGSDDGGEGRSGLSMQTMARLAEKECFFRPIVTPFTEPATLQGLHSPQRAKTGERSPQRSRSAARTGTGLSQQPRAQTSDPADWSWGKEDKGKGKGKKGRPSTLDSVGLRNATADHMGPQGSDDPRTWGWGSQSNWNKTGANGGSSDGSPSPHGRRGELFKSPEGLSPTHGVAQHHEIGAKRQPNKRQPNSPNKRGRVAMSAPVRSTED